MNNDSFIPTYKLLIGIWGHLQHRRRTQVGIILILMLASGVAELLSLGSVIPFLAVLSDPNQFWAEPQVRQLASWFGCKVASDLLLPTTFIFAFSTVLATFIRLTTLWANGRLAAIIGSDLSCESYKRTIYQPYGVHVRRNSAQVITAITTQIGQTVAAINALLQIITFSVVALCLLAGLLLIDYSIAISAILVFGGAYLILALTTRSVLRGNSHLIYRASTQQLKSLQEGIGAIRDVLIDGSQSFYLQKYKEADRPLRTLSALNAFLTAFPRYVLEALGIVFIAFIGLIIVFGEGSSGSVISLLGVFALASQRLLPALQQIYSGWAVLKGENAAIQSVFAMLNQPLSPQSNSSQSFRFRKSIYLESVDFRYDSDQSLVLRGLNLNIHRGERIGLIGGTGSGKSTTVDLLMGLLEPTSGKLLVDGINVHDSNDPNLLLSWRASITHVPQNVYLIDATIAENIAFGVRCNDINFSRVTESAKKAQISDFIEDLPLGYNTVVGENGIRLSGGQRQRIALARALYKQSKVIILDEATSALDTETEKQ